MLLRICNDCSYYSSKGLPRREDEPFIIIWRDRGSISSGAPVSGPRSRGEQQVISAVTTESQDGFGSGEIQIWAEGGLTPFDLAGIKERN